jgi:hypothetical protein
MTNPAYVAGFSGPFGLLAVAGAGYLVYRIGKGKGKSAEDKNAGEGILDRTIKGAMRVTYKAKMGVDKTLEEKKKRFSEMWKEAKEEVRK